jgi:Poly(R)-hydroxyalkanoic acid synthase subunit (PHA_synth_III_E)
VGDDIWSQWQAFAALMGQAGHATPQFRSAYDGTLGFAPFIAAGERFTAAASKYLEDTAHASAPAAAEAARNFSDFLRGQSNDFFRFPWSADFGVGVASGAPAASMLGVPALGLTREHQQRWQRAADAARRTAEAQRQLQLQLADALRDAATAFAARLELRQPAAESAEALRGLYDSWIDCSEEAYARTAHSDSFCKALADFVNAGSLLRKELQANMEHWAKVADLPTRNELNTLTQRLISVEGQLRAPRSERKPRGSKSNARHSIRARRAKRGKKP